MGQWRDIVSPSGKLLARIDPERRLLEIVRNQERILVDLDAYLFCARNAVALQQGAEADT